MGLLDVDICGPSIPRMLGALGAKVHQSVDGWSPVWLSENLGVMSIGFMLPGEDDAVIWRGPKKNGLIQQFLGDVEWGELDYLVVDTPPGTSDEHISVVQLLKGGGAGGNLAGAVVVTTPQEVALADVRKELNFCVCVGRGKRPGPATGPRPHLTQSPPHALLYTQKNGRARPRRGRKHVGLLVPLLRHVLAGVSALWRGPAGHGAAVWRAFPRRTAH